MINDVLVLFAMTMSLLFVVEGLFPFISPKTWKEVLARCAQFEDKSIRFWSLLSMLFGVLLMYLIHHLVIQN